MIFDRIDTVCEQRFKTYFSPSEIQNSPKLNSLHTKGFRLSKVDSEFYILKVIIACLTVRLVMKKYISKCKLRRTYDKYYDIISKYSSKRLFTLLRIKTFQIIFKEFFTSPDFEEMLNSDESLMVDKASYSDKASKIMHLINSKSFIRL